MMLPDYWLTRPLDEPDDDVRRAFDELLHASLDTGGCPTIEFALPHHRWQFLCHVVEHHDIVVHGSGSPDIDQFEPRRPSDLTEFGNQAGVNGVLKYPTSDTLTTSDKKARYNNFENGRIYYRGSAGTFTVPKPYFTKHESLKGIYGYLGYPTSAVKTSASRCRNGSGRLMVSMRPPC